MTQRQRRHIWEMLPIFLIALALLYYCCTAALCYGRLDAGIGTLSQGWTLNGAAVEALPARDMRAPGEKTVMRTALPDAFDDAQAIAFYTSYADVEVKLNGRSIYRLTKPEAEKMTSCAPSQWNVVRLPSGSSGAQLQIDLATPYSKFANLIPECRYGSAEEIDRLVQMKTVPHFVAGLAILFIGIIFSLVAVIMRYYVIGSTGLYSLSLFMVVLAVFLTSRQTTLLMNVYGGSNYVLIQDVAFMLCPVMYTRYLMRVHKGLSRKIALGLHLASLLNLALVLALQLTGVLESPQMTVVTRDLCAVIIVYTFILEFRQQNRVLVCLMALAVGYVAVRYYLTDTISWLVYLALFGNIYVMVYRVIRAVVVAQAKQIRLEAALEVSKSEIATIQITSHFFYHTLDSIRALIRMDADKAYKMTGDFAKYIRYRVDGVERMQETVPFSRELRSIRAYTDIKQAQLGERFEMIFDVETEDFEILPLTVQPPVENAVIHAVQRRRGGGRVVLKCREAQKGYHIEVIDNGPGEGADTEIHEKQKKSTAIANVNTRLEFYGIAPLKFEKNELGGITVSLDTPKEIHRKGKDANEGNIG